MGVSTPIFFSTFPACRPYQGFSRFPLTAQTGNFNAGGRTTLQPVNNTYICRPETQLSLTFPF
jgi:hypothetical protein